MSRSGLALACALTLVGCTRGEANTSAPVNVTSTDYNITDDTLTSSDTGDNTSALNTAPIHYYDEHEGDRYLYVGAVSEDDKKSGRAVGNVVEYRYVGIRDGMTTLERVTDSGQVLGLLQCTSPCRVMKVTNGYSVDRMPYDTASIAGAAMSDAITGQLEPVKPPPPPPAEVLSALPDKFVGKWNVNVFQCFDDDVATTLVVTPSALQFQQVTATVTSVALKGQTAIVTADVSNDDNEAVRSLKYTLRLNGGGDQLTIGGVVRTKCPPR